jgi:mannan polymerase II complex MNN10 subunit
VIEYHNANATDEHQMSEQDCMRDILFRSAFMEDKFVMLPQWKINAFPQEIPCYDQRDKKVWERGIFTLHFAGAWAHVKEEDPTGFLMRKYEQEIIW